MSCYLFFSDDNGHLYRSRTSIANFPNGFTDNQIVLSDPNRFALFEASNVYKIRGQQAYLLVVEAIGSDGKRYFRSWTTNRLDGAWTRHRPLQPAALAAGPAHPDQLQLLSQTAVDARAVVMFSCSGSAPRIVADPPLPGE